MDIDTRFKNCFLYIKNTNLEVKQGKREVIRKVKSKDDITDDTGHGLVKRVLKRLKIENYIFGIVEIRIGIKIFEWRW
jgi:hypothetical protein